MATQGKSLGPLAPWLRRTVRDKRRTRSKRTARAAVKCTLSEDWIAAQSHVSHCPITGLPLNLSRPGTNGNLDPLAPSLDRIDPALPYTDANTRVVSFFANVAKNAWSDREFRLLILATAANMVHR